MQAATLRGVSGITDVHLTDVCSHSCRREAFLFSFAPDPLILSALSLFLLPLSEGSEMSWNQRRTRRKSREGERCGMNKKKLGGKRDQRSVRAMDRVNVSFPLTWTEIQIQRQEKERRLLVQPSVWSRVSREVVLGVREWEAGPAGKETDCTSGVIFAFCSRPEMKWKGRRYREMGKKGRTTGKKTQKFHESEKTVTAENSLQNRFVQFKWTAIRISWRRRSKSQKRRYEMLLHLLITSGCSLFFFFKPFCILLRTSILFLPNSGCQEILCPQREYICYVYRYFPCISFSIVRQFSFSSISCQIEASGRGKSRFFAF